MESIDQEFSGQRNGPANRPFRLGVWCHYGATLTPQEGIGVFTYNLMDGLLQLPENVELVILVRPGDQGLVENLRRQAPSRVRVLPEPGQSLGARLRISSWAAAWVRQSDRLRNQVQARLNALDKVRNLVWLRIKNGWMSLARKASYGHRLAALIAILTLPLGFLGAWLAVFLLATTRAVGQTFVFPLNCLDGLIRLAGRNSRLMSCPTSLQMARDAGCDIWLLPNVCFEYPIDFPAVIFIHDLVVYHYPERFDPTYVEHVKRIVPQRAREAVLCGCLSEFIRQNDLLGVLGLSKAKTRMIRPAAPRDFPQVTPAQARQLKPTSLKRPFLFFPAAFRGYKNHAGLIEALAVLEQHHGVRDFDLVFTGTSPGQLPLELLQLAHQTGLQDRIHVLGRVSRETLAALYQEAFATLMASFYEQGSFPVYEALYWHCPVACSDIPAMREQCGSMGDAMLYFDPHDPRAMARIILAIQADRAGIRQRQQRAAWTVWYRTWKDVAAEWMPIFREAACSDNNPNKASPITKIAA